MLIEQVHIAHGHDSAHHMHVSWISDSADSRYHPNNPNNPGKIYIDKTLFGNHIWSHHHHELNVASSNSFDNLHFALLNICLSNDSLVFYGEQKDDLSSSQAALAPIDYNFTMQNGDFYQSDLIFHAHLVGLSADTLYYYAIGKATLKTKSSTV